MKLIRQAIEQISGWIDVLANAAVALLGRFGQPHLVELVETEAGAFTVRTKGKAGSTRVQAAALQINGEGEVRPPSSEAATSLKGSRAEIVLQPSRFVFRQVEFPRRASEFLDGIIRTQIDRLTPWSAKEAIFGWTKPIDIANDKIAVTVAATSRKQIMPYVQAISGFGADSTTVLTIPDTPEHGLAPIRVLELKGGSARGLRLVRQALIAILIIAGLAAAVSVGTAVVVAENLAARQDDLARRLVDRRAALRATRDAGSDTALIRLERRKHENPSSVIVLEALSQILPDHTFVTELRIEGNKIQVIGVTRDAPSLIRLIEQSSHFTHATFFAPTTRSPSEPGDRFHIEVRIAQLTAPRT
jgi:general secretion pathway protein L